MLAAQAKFHNKTKFSVCLQRSPIISCLANRLYLRKRQYVGRHCAQFRQMASLLIKQYPFHAHEVTNAGNKNTDVGVIRGGPSIYHNRQT